MKLSEKIIEERLRVIGVGGFSLWLEIFILRLAMTEMTYFESLPVIIMHVGLHPVSYAPFLKTYVNEYVCIYLKVYVSQGLLCIFSRMFLFMMYV